ncbi:hypothetical protein PIROE2DRAFT_1449 [Piromyces sp. E2]|nr:hypothetical protein PIROE2DRAFT_1449 [Piromyces sp. E2]|eukprot:OUM70318.1 hypothetical protein PIROE2DRAFT_1449 [Piromyces sp. E2]
MVNYTKNYYLLLLLLFFISGIVSEIVSKEEILKLKPQKCTEDNECGDTKCWNGYCDRIFYCHDNDCIRQTEEMSFDSSITEENYKSTSTTKLIIESCPEEVRNIKKCFTQYCKDDSNCFSNRCVNNTCIANKNITTNICKLKVDRDEMICYKPALESCNNDKECYMGFCNEQHICSDKVVKKPYIDYTIFIIIFIVIAVVVILLLLKKYCFTTPKDKATSK